MKENLSEFIGRGVDRLKSSAKVTPLIGVVCTFTTPLLARELNLEGRSRIALATAVTNGLEIGLPIGFGLTAGLPELGIAYAVSLHYFHGFFSMLTLNQMMEDGHNISVVISRPRF